MDKKFRNIHEGKEEPLSEIAKRVNAFLDPILEEKFDLKARKEYIQNNRNEFWERAQDITYKADNLGLTGENIADSEEMAQEIGKAYSEFDKTKKLIYETKPDKSISLNLGDEIKGKYDKDGRLEKELSKVYGLKEGMESWRVFMALLNATLPENPFYWDELKAESEIEG